MYINRFKIQKRIISNRRSFSISTFQFTQIQSDTISFPSETRGLDYDLNWSLAAE